MTLFERIRSKESYLERLGSFSMSAQTQERAALKNFDDFCIFKFKEKSDKIVEELRNKLAEKDSISSKLEEKNEAEREEREKRLAEVEATAKTLAEKVEILETMKNEIELIHSKMKEILIRETDPSNPHFPDGGPFDTRLVNLRLDNINENRMVIFDSEFDEFITVVLRKGKLFCTQDRSGACKHILFALANPKFYDIAKKNNIQIFSKS